MKKLSKLTLRKEDVEQSDILSKKELKAIMGGYDGGNYVGMNCYNRRCFVDIQWDSGQIDCWIEVPMHVCESNFGVTC